MERFAVIGAGKWGAMHVRAYTQCGHAELVALCDVDEERARRVAGLYGVPKTFTSVDALLEEDLDGVSVATPDASHGEIVVKAARRGLHVLVEKPLATTLEECRAMVDAAEKAGVILMVDWHNRWNPPYHHACQAIRRGELGDVRYVYYRLSDAICVPTQMLPWARESSVMWFLGSHALDTTCWLVGKRPQRVTCRRREGVLSGRGVPTPDLFVTMVDFEGGALAVIENLWILPDCSPALIDHKCEIVGTEGVIYIDPTHDRSFAKYTPGTRMPGDIFPDMFVAPEIHGRQMGFAVESIYHFAECVTGAGAVRDAHGRGSAPFGRARQPLATGRDGLLNTRLILAALRSAEEDRAVELQDA